MDPGFVGKPPLNRSIEVFKAGHAQLQAPRVIRLGACNIHQALLTSGRSEAFFVGVARPNINTTIRRITKREAMSGRKPARFDSQNMNINKKRLAYTNTPVGVFLRLMRVS